MNKTIVRSARLLIFSVSLSFLGYALSKVDFQELINLEVKYTLLIVSVFLSIAFRFALTFAWLRSILNNQGKITNFIQAINIYATSWVARYIPGGIFSHLERIIMGKEYGISITNSVLASITETLLQILSLALICFILLIFSESILPGISTEITVIAAIIIVLSLAAFTPSAMNLIKSAISKIGKKNIPDTTVTLKFLALQLVIYLFSLTIANIAFLIFSMSIIQETSYHIAYTILVANLIVSLASMVIVFIPAGIGVREAGLVYLLMPILGTETAIVISIASRLWTIACDILFLVSSKIIKNFGIK